MQADLQLVAALLRCGRSLDHFSTALSLVAVVLGLGALDPAHHARFVPEMPEHTAEDR